MTKVLDKKVIDSYDIDNVWLYVQENNPTGILSGVTAANILGLNIEEQGQNTLELTFKRGHHRRFFTELAGYEYVEKTIKPDTFLLGRTVIEDQWGDKLTVYDAERTIIDIWGDSNLSEGFKRRLFNVWYHEYEHKNIEKLYDYLWQLPKTLKNESLRTIVGTLEYDWNY